MLHNNENARSVVSVTPIRSFTHRATGRAACLLFLLSGSASLTYGANFVLSTNFDATMTAPFVGSGLLSYDADEALEDGSYKWETFDNLQLSLVFDEVTFTATDLQTPTNEVFIEVRSGNFFFSNFYGTGYDDYGGSTYFLSNGYVLSTEAYKPGEGQSTSGGVGGMEAPVYLFGIDGESGPLYKGTYGVIPESSSVALLLGGGAMAMVLVVRRRQG